jgi:hypothetical protein
MKALLLFVSATVSIFLAACSAVTEDAVESFSEKHIQSVQVTPRQAKGADLEYLLEIQLQPDLGDIEVPDGFSILGQPEEGGNVTIFDDGQGDDVSGNDGIYTGVISQACLPPDTSSGKITKWKCKLGFAKPGESCGNWGACPETSILGGKTIFCVCILECEFGSSKMEAPVRFES